MTIIDVAKASGFSKSTVSRVINGHDTVAPDVVRRVKETMKQMGYYPPAKRRGPKPTAVRRRGLTMHNIGLLILGRTRELLEFPSVARLLARFSETAQNLDLRPIIIEMPDLSVVPDVVRNAGVDGLVVIGRDIDQDLIDIFHPTPVVWQGGRPLDIPLVDHVTTNSRAAGILAADYMKRHHASDLVWMNHDAQHLAFPLLLSSFKERIEQTDGIRLRQYISPVSSLTETDMWSTRQIRDDYSILIDDMLSDGGIPDGIFVPTDQQCSILHALLKERGIVVGKDLLTISCNNDPQWLATMHPQPATIDLCSGEQGKVAVKTLLNRITKPSDDPLTIMVTPKLIEP